MAPERQRIAIPYGSGSLEADVPARRASCSPASSRSSPRSTTSGRRCSRDSSGRPGARPLREIAEERATALVLVDDNTRHTPVDRILPVLLDYLNEAGLADEDIRILTASGTHRVMTDDEVLAKVGEEAHRRVAITQHDCRDLESIVEQDPVSGGNSIIPVQINRKVLDADLVIGLGSIFPHSDAGFTGGAKIVQPGVCGTTTTAATHIAAALLDEIPLGDADSPCRLGMEEVARKVGLDFIINVVQDHRGRVLEIVAGDFVAAHRLGAEVSRRAHGVAVPEPADVVIVGSYPGDIDWWQAEKCLVAAYFAVKPGGVVVFAGPCYEGLVHNHPRLRDWLRAVVRRGAGQGVRHRPGRRRGRPHRRRRGHRQRQGTGEGHHPHGDRGPVGRRRRTARLPAHAGPADGGGPCAGARSRGQHRRPSLRRDLHPGRRVTAGAEERDAAATRSSVSSRA